jgi:hypothetical protein
MVKDVLEVSRRICIKKYITKIDNFNFYLKFFNLNNVKQTKSLLINKKNTTKNKSKN